MPVLLGFGTVLRTWERRCHPAYLSEDAHKILPRPGAFDGLRVHTDEFVEVLARIKPETVTVAVVRTSNMNLARHRSPSRRSWTTWTGSTPMAFKPRRSVSCSPSQSECMLIDVCA